MEHDYDAIIIGGGISGSYLGHLLASQGRKTLIIEKNRGTKKDSGIVSARVFDFIKLPRRLIKKNVKQMKFVSPSGKSFLISSEKPFAFILRRGEFERHLRRMATKSGAKFLYEECKGIRILESGAEAFAGRRFTAKIIIGCDGANSIVRRCLGFSNPSIFSAAISYGRMKGKTDNEITIYFNNFFSPHFFSWFIPYNNEAGLICKTDLFDYMQFFHRSVGFVPRKTLCSIIPIGTTKSFYDRCLLVGDSCGQVKPSTGGGIVYSLIAASIAAETIKQAFEQGRFDSNMLENYEREWKKRIGSEIRFQLFLRKLYRKLSNRDIDELFEDFGPHVSQVKDFDYDCISSIIWKMPKIKTLKYVLKYIPLMFEWSYG